MPEIEGIETITKIKKIDPNAKIIAISGGGRNDPRGYLDLAEKFGVERTFEKPIDWPKLVEAVKALLN